jgi:hypothetical protein
MGYTMRESAHSPENQLGGLAAVLLFAAAALQPGVLVGAGLTLAWWHWAAPPLRRRLAAAIIATAAFGAALPAVAWAWPWRLLLAGSRFAGIPAAAHLDPSTVLLSVASTALAGPAWALGLLLIRWTREGMPAGMIERERRRLEERRRHLDQRPSPADLPKPEGTIRLGVTGRREPVVLQLPADLAQHVTILGKMGSGKTTTAARLVEGACQAGWPVVIVDAKGFGSLRTVAQRFAERFHRPFNLVAPDDPASLLYNPCTGTPSQISNKLIGAFSFGEAAEIYKNIAQEVIPVLVRAIRAAGRPVTLETLARSLAPEGMVGLSRAIPSGLDGVADYLRDLSDRRAPYPAGYAGMRSRLMALLQGMYGQLLMPGEGESLDLDAAFDAPAITYISLPAMEASEDVELMARVLAQDVKQVAASHISRGAKRYALLILDEFAALREASQLNDLLLQAREARICCVVATQFLPSEVDAQPLRHALLSCGLFLSHQCSAEDAEAVAAVFGTRRTVEVTHQVDYQTGTSEKGSMRRVDEFRVHPNELRDLPCGMGAARIEASNRRIALVQIDRPLEMKGA